MIEIVSVLRFWKKADKEFGLEVNSGETQYLFMSHHQNAEQSYNKNIANKFFENVKNFKYLGMIVTNQEYIQ
jgi:hypothetical protein